MRWQGGQACGVACCGPLPRVKRWFCYSTENGLSEARRGGRRVSQEATALTRARDDVQLDSDVARRLGKMWKHSRNMLELEWRSLVMDHL